MLEPTRRPSWYETSAFVIVALIVFWPVGLGLMWSRRKFSSETRARITVAAPLLTLLLIGALVSEPPEVLVGAGEPPRTAADATQDAIDSLVPSGTTVATPSVAATTAVGESTAPSSSPTPPASQTPSGSAPPLPAPQSGPQQARFTLEGTYQTTDSGSSVTFTLTALPYADIVSYSWWVNAGGSTASYTGITVGDTYPGLPPTSVRLVVTASNGKTYTSEASVEATAGRVYAAVR